VRSPLGKADKTALVNSIFRSGRARPESPLGARDGADAAPPPVVVSPPPGVEASVPQPDMKATPAKLEDFTFLKVCVFIFSVFLFSS
jgi:hypothetical protein